ncbi:uncharacterized mitochondrial protein AtMg00810-like [Impatiens glandulifera]|uniref:uncharacterized mitochondrial protein AtMg00810-like n=1 Tax=Impatiens glandulifera TaxID=253017 RepID=UPI001FB0910D|nr:uncharacterized mitochondrial protein AtMg00810-like [Impatiens glandulifera]
MVVVLLYVDNIILMDNNYDEVARLQDELSFRFKMKKLGELGIFLGLQIENFEKSLFVSQINYAKKLVDKFGPNIAYTVRVVISYMQEPRKQHLYEAKKIMKYINTLLDISLLYEKDAKFVLQIFANADFAGNRDDRRLTSMFVFHCGNTRISWSRRKQGSLSLYTTEVEYKALAHAAQ